MDVDRSESAIGRRRRALRVVVCVAALLVTSPILAEETTPPPAERAPAVSKFASPEDVQTWIKQLSDDSYTVRQAAAERLLHAGMPARHALIAVADGPDPESRASARRLIALIDRTAFNQQLEAFAADVDGKRGLTLPGWERYRKLVGSDPAARALFVQMHRAEGPLLSAVFGVSSQPAEQLWEDRLTRLVSRQVMTGSGSVAPPLGSCAAVIFLGAVPEIEVSDRGAVLVENLIQRPPVAESLSAEGGQESVRQLVGSWLLHCSNKNEVILGRRLQLMQAINLKDALPLALAVATGEEPYGKANPATRATALLAVGRFGNREHAEKLEPLLEDATICMPLQAPQPGQPVMNVQVRDVALCVMLHLTGQKPSEYGYLHARPQPQQLFQIQTLHAANDEVRSDAAAKWRAWRKTEGAREKDEGRKVER